MKVIVKVNASSQELSGIFKVNFELSDVDSLNSQLLLPTVVYHVVLVEDDLRLQNVFLERPETLQMYRFTSPVITRKAKLQSFRKILLPKLVF